MLAEIASGNTDTADVLFLIAAIVFGIAALVALFAYRPAPGPNGRVAPLWFSPVLVPAGLCLTAIGLLVL